MFLQPYSPTVITMLRDASPSPENPIQAFFSTTDDLQTIGYRAEIVGWEDKRVLSPERQAEINRQIAELQPGEGQLYHASKAAGGESVNLIHISHLRRMDPPLRVSQLTKASDGQPASENRTRSGGFTYVRPMA